MQNGNSGLQEEQREPDMILFLAELIEVQISLST